MFHLTCLFFFSLGEKIAWQQGHLATTCLLPWIDLIDPLDTPGGQSGGLALIHDNKVSQVVDPLAHTLHKKVPLADANSPSL